MVAGAALLHGCGKLLGPRVILTDGDDRWANAGGGTIDRKGNRSGLAMVNRRVDKRRAPCHHLRREVIGGACRPRGRAIESARGGGSGSAEGCECLRLERQSLGCRNGSVVGEAVRVQLGKVSGLLTLGLGDLGSNESGLPLQCL